MFLRFMRETLPVMAKGGAATPCKRTPLAVCDAGSAFRWLSCQHGATLPPRLRRAPFPAPLGRRNALGAGIIAAQRRRRRQVHAVGSTTRRAVDLNVVPRSSRRLGARGLRGGDVTQAPTVAALRAWCGDPVQCHCHTRGRPAACVGAETRQTCSVSASVRGNATVQGLSRSQETVIRVGIGGHLSAVSC